MLGYLIIFFLGIIMFHGIVDLLSSPSHVDYYNDLSRRNRIENFDNIRRVIAATHLEVDKVLEAKRIQLLELKAIEDDRDLYVDVVQDYCTTDIPYDPEKIKFIL